MLFRVTILNRIKTGDISLAFRRWRRPTVKAGGRLRTAVGELAIDTVAPCEEDDITEADARTAGFADRRELLAELRQRDEGALYRIAFHFAGADSRVELRGRNDLSSADIDEIGARLAKLDSKADRPWTTAVLRHIEQNESSAAREIAVALDIDKTVLKPNIRKLKALGLTESLQTGYRLSPRGRAILKTIA